MFSFGKNRRAVGISALVGGLAFAAVACRPHNFGKIAAEATAVTTESAPASADKSGRIANSVPVIEKAPVRVHNRAADLPAPFATTSANRGPRVVERPDGAALTLPPGFHIHYWAQNLNNPRYLAVAPNGDVFVSESGPNRLTVLRDGGTGKATTNKVFASDLKQPFGIAFYPPGPDPKFVYVANTDSVVRFPYHNGDLTATGGAETIVGDLPGGGYHQHWTRTVAFRPDGKKMYVSVGSQSNIGEEEEKRAAILEYNPDGTGYRVYAHGIRNAVGLAFNPLDKTLWMATNERDGLGDDLVPDYASSVKESGFYGWPWYYDGANHDPRMPERPELKNKTLVPDVLFQSHVAALEIQFYTANQFPAEYKNSAFVAQHGSWNRSVRSGYAVARVLIGRDGKSDGSYENFITGWAMSDGTVWGRPVGVAVGKDGSLFVSDDGGNCIWQVTYEKPNAH